MSMRVEIYGCEDGKHVTVKNLYKEKEIQFATLQFPVDL